MSIRYVVIAALGLTALGLVALGGCQSQSQPQSQPQSQSQTQPQTQSQTQPQTQPQAQPQTAPRESTASGATATPPAGSHSPQTKASGASQGPSGSEASTESAAGEPSSSSTASSDGQPPLSEAEQAGALDAQLEESLAVFDGMILEQGAQIEAAQTSNGNGADGAGAGDAGYDDEGYDGEGYEEGGGNGNDPLFEEGELGASDTSTDASGGQPGPQSGERSGPDSESGNGGQSSSGRQAGHIPGSGGAVPKDIPRGQDDDIVARQIREAAMQEKDPVLREKLWNEYRKYKNQQKAN